MHTLNPVGAVGTQVSSVLAHDPPALLVQARALVLQVPGRSSVPGAWTGVAVQPASSARSGETVTDATALLVAS
jgi:hypothetical protein